MSSSVSERRDAERAAHRARRDADSRVLAEARRINADGGVRSDWYVRALCAEVGPGLFGADYDPEDPSAEAAKQVCALCDVRAECLAESIALGDRSGIRGGLSMGQLSSNPTTYR